METKTLKTRMKQKSAKAEDWAKAENFAPLEGEICFYSDLNKFKIGDGKTKINELEFANEQICIINIGTEDGEVYTCDKTNKVLISAYTTGKRFVITIDGQYPTLSQTINYNEDLKKLTLTFYNILGDINTDSQTVREITVETTDDVNGYPDIDYDKRDYKQFTGYVVAGQKSDVELGNAATAEGFDVEASDDYSHAEGLGTIANKEAQHVSGKYNIADGDEENHLVIVGNGNGIADDIHERSNAYTLDQEGNGWFAGDVFIGKNEKGVNTKLEDLDKRLQIFEYKPTEISSLGVSWTSTPAETEETKIYLNEPLTIDISKVKANFKSAIQESEIPKSETPKKQSEFLLYINNAQEHAHIFNTSGEKSYSTGDSWSWSKDIAKGDSEDISIPVKGTLNIYNETLNITTTTNTSSNISIKRFFDICYGYYTGTASEETDTYDTAFIKALSQKDTANSIGTRHCTFELAKEHYFYFCIPASMTKPKFDSSGFEVTMELRTPQEKDQVSYKPKGESEDDFSIPYNVYRSINKINNITINITPQ